MRFSAEWIYSEEGIGNIPEEPAWVGLGYIIADAGLLLLIAAIALAGGAARRARTAEVWASGCADAQVRVASAAIGLLLVAYVVAVWAMTTKPV